MKKLNKSRDYFTIVGVMGVLSVTLMIVELISEVIVGWLFVIIPAILFWAVIVLRIVEWLNERADRQEKQDGVFARADGWIYISESELNTDGTQEEKKVKKVVEESPKKKRKKYKKRKKKEKKTTQKGTKEKEENIISANNRKEKVVERVAEYLKENPKARWEEIYKNVDNHYKSVNSLRTNVGRELDRKCDYCHKVYKTKGSLRSHIYYQRKNNGTHE